MTLVQLTEVTHGEPRPFAVNPDHVATLRPRKTIIPIDAQQDPRGIISYNGTILVLATGEQHFVTEDFDTVAGLLNPAQMPPPLAPPPIPRGDAVGPSPKKSHHKQPEKPPTPEKPAQDPEPSSSTDLKTKLLPSAASPE